MSTAIHFHRGRCTLLKGFLLIVLIVALLAIINYNIRDDASKEDLVKREDIVKENSENNGYVDDLLKKPGSTNPCYKLGSEMFCGPAVYLMGIQYAGLNILKKAIGLHPDVDCYASGFFSNFTDLEDIKRSDVMTYFRSFDESTRKIYNGSDKLCICDSGNDLARPYDLNMNKGVISPPKYTTPEALVNIHSDMKVIVVLRDPTVRFIREYCALGMTEPLEEVVDKAIEGFENCENDKEQDNASCVYDINLSGLLQAGLYDFLIEKDLNRSFSLNSFRLIAWDHLENPMKRNATMISIFNFLGKDIPSANEPFWTALDALFTFPSGDCNIQMFPAATKQKLNEFYRKRAVIYDIVC